MHDVRVLLRGVQFTFVQRFLQLYFLIHYYCDNTRKVRAPNAVRRSGAPHVLASLKVKKILKETSFSELNLGALNNV
jgi:hypothetical protein